MLLDSIIGYKAHAVLGEWDYGQTEGANYFNTFNFHMLLQVPGRADVLGEGGRQVRDSVVITKSSLSKTDLSATTPPGKFWKFVISALKLENSRVLQVLGEQPSYKRRRRLRVRLTPVWRHRE